LTTFDFLFHLSSLVGFELFLRIPEHMKISAFSNGILISTCTAHGALYTRSGGESGRVFGAGHGLACPHEDAKDGVQPHGRLLGKNAHRKKMTKIIQANSVESLNAEGYRNTAKKLADLSNRDTFGDMAVCRTKPQNTESLRQSTIAKYL